MHTLSQAEHSLNYRKRSKPHNNMLLPPPPQIQTTHMFSPDFPQVHKDIRP